MYNVVSGTVRTLAAVTRPLHGCYSTVTRPIYNFWCECRARLIISHFTINRCCRVLCIIFFAIGRQRKRLRSLWRRCRKPLGTKSCMKHKSLSRRTLFTESNSEVPVQQRKKSPTFGRNRAFRYSTPLIAIHHDVRKCKYPLGRTMNNQAALVLTDTQTVHQAHSRSPGQRTVAPWTIIVIRWRIRSTNMALESCKIY